MTEQQHTGSAYTRWSEDVRHKYISIISDARIILNQIPRWEGSGLVFDSDVDDLVMLCEMFDINIDDIISEINREQGRMRYLKKIMDDAEDDEESMEKDDDARALLYDISVFKAIKGHIYKKMRMIVEKELKPTNPLMEKIDALDDIEDRHKREVVNKDETNI